MAIQPFSKLPIVMNRIAKSHVVGVGSVMRRASKAALRGLVEGTPVDTGRARSNWRVTLDGPSDGQIEPFVPGVKLGINERGNASAAISAGNTVINIFNPKVNRALFIQNNVPYIGLLNDGSSSQQPGNFIELAVLFAIAEARSQNIIKRTR